MSLDKETKFLVLAQATGKLLDAYCSQCAAADPRIKKQDQNAAIRVLTELQKQAPSWYAKRVVGGCIRACNGCYNRGGTEAVLTGTYTCGMNEGTMFTPPSSRRIIRRAGRR